ncbi:uncharacterized protein LOC127850017 isoform X1 [Dreissena polymorpha]|uniref:Tantalus-like domain-containing protein n=2 Tax=Dreissena polymorpha TaxID=45954 RepID=A0A9D4S232_DREPO|nr:uncharacterized protein LOC127850017 isoform X1 [Dreissena polymorpha]KAH3889679.1 hypothetical protein DPMN_013740 [Dreissena polymorpha]
MLEEEIDHGATRKRRRRSVRNLRRTSGIILLPNINDEIEAALEKIEVNQDHEAEAPEVYGSLWMECQAPVTKKRRRRSNFVVGLPLDEDHECCTDRNQYMGNEPKTEYSDIQSHENEVVGIYSDQTFNKNQDFESSGYERSKIESNAWNQGEINKSAYNDDYYKSADLQAMKLRNSDKDTNAINLQPNSGIEDDSMLPKIVSAIKDVSTPLSEHNLSLTSKLSPASMSPDYPMSPDKFVADFHESFTSVSESNQDLNSENTNDNSWRVNLIDYDKDINLCNVSVRSDSSSEKENTSVFERNALDVTPQDTGFPDDVGSNRSPGFLELCKTFAGKVVDFVKTSPSYLTGTIKDSTNLLNVATNSTSPCLSKEKQVSKKIVALSIEQSTLQPFKLTVCNVAEDQDTLANTTNQTEGVINQCTTIDRSTSAACFDKSQKKDHTECLSNGKMKRTSQTFFNAFNAISSAFNRERSCSASSLPEKSPAGVESQENNTSEECKEESGVERDRVQDSLNEQVETSCDSHATSLLLKETESSSKTTVTCQKTGFECAEKPTVCNEEIENMEAKTLDHELTANTPNGHVPTNENLLESGSNQGSNQMDNEAHLIKPSSKRKHKRRALSVPPAYSIHENGDCLVYHDVPKLSDLCEMTLKIYPEGPTPVVKSKARVSKTKDNSQRRRSGRHTVIKNLCEDNKSGKSCSYTQTCTDINDFQIAVISESTCKSPEAINENINRNANSICSDDKQISKCVKDSVKKRRQRSFSVVKALEEISDEEQIKIDSASKRNVCSDNQDEVDGCSERSGLSQQLETGIAMLDISERQILDYQKTMDESMPACEENTMSVNYFDICNEQKVQKRRGRPPKSSLVSLNVGETALTSITEELSQVAIKEIGSIAQNLVCESIQNGKMLTPEDIISPDYHSVPRKRRRRSSTMSLKMIQDEMANSHTESSVTENQSSEISAKTQTENSMAENQSTKITAKTNRKRKQEEVSPEQLELLYRNKNFVKPEEKKSWQTIFESPHVSGEVYGKKRLQRHIDFTQPTLVKLKRRVQKAMKNGWDPKRKRKTELKDEYVREKLDKFWSEMEENPENSLENKLKNMFATQ